MVSTPMSLGELACVSGLFSWSLSRESFCLIGQLVFATLQHSPRAGQSQWAGPDRDLECPGQAHHWVPLETGRLQAFVKHAEETEEWEKSRGSQPSLAPHSQGKGSAETPMLPTAPFFHLPQEHLLWLSKALLYFQSSP